MTKSAALAGESAQFGAVAVASAKALMQLYRLEDRMAGEESEEEVAEALMEIPERIRKMSPALVGIGERLEKLKEKMADLMIGVGEDDP